MNKKILFSIILIFAFLFVGKAFAITEAERQQLVKNITDEIAKLQAKLVELQNLTVTDTQNNQETVLPNNEWCHNFSVILSVGNSGEEVSALQTALIKEGLLTSITKPTGYFHTSTYNAVVAFQKKYNISGTGRVGPNTNIKLTQLYGCSSQDSVQNSVANSTQDSNSNSNSNVNVSQTNDDNATVYISQPNDTVTSQNSGGALSSSTSSSPSSTSSSPSSTSSSPSSTSSSPSSTSSSPSSTSSNSNSSSNSSSVSCYYDNDCQHAFKSCGYSCESNVCTVKSSSKVYPNCSVKQSDGTCSYDFYQCSDGTYVYPDVLNNCNFPDCSGSASGSNPPTISLSVNSYSASESNCTVNVWHSKNNITSCTGSGDWSSNFSTNGSGSQTVVVPCNKKTLKFVMSCSGSGGSASKTITFDASPWVIETGKQGLGSFCYKNEDCISGLSCLLPKGYETSIYIKKQCLCPNRTAVGCIFDDGIGSPGGGSGGEVGIQNNKCKTNKECQDKYNNCYYWCVSSECKAISTFLKLKPYPDCSSSPTLF